MALEITSAQDRLLREHRLGVLATGRRDGSPQIATVMYDWNGSDLVVSTDRGAAKQRNAERVPRVAFLVLDGRQQVIVYGTATVQPDGAERREGMRRLRAKANRPQPELSDAELDATLDEREQVLLRITPERVLGGE